MRSCTVTTAFVLYEHQDRCLHDTKTLGQIDLCGATSEGLKELITTRFKTAPQQCPVLIEKPPDSHYGVKTFILNTSQSVGFILSLQTIHHTMDSKMAALKGIRNLKPFMGAEGQKEDADAWHDVVDQAAL